jgi:dTDP-4-amino-4,6-dideoxygalactose transaminase
MCGVGPDAGLLAPAYHCRTMLDPAISLNAVITLYPLLSNLAPDLLALEAQLISMPQRPRAMLLTHYFGFPQDAASIKAFCDQHDLALIEDCSHALFNPQEQPRLGQFGRYTIASPYKLLPCEEGGMLIAAKGVALEVTSPRRARLLSEAKTLANALMRTRTNQKQRVNAQDIAELPAALARILATPIAAAVERSSPEAGTSKLYLEAEQGLAGAVASRLLIQISHLSHAVSRRRENYLTWEKQVQSLPHCKPLFPALPNDCVPYMFPLLLDFPQQHFFALKKLGLPIWRWDDMGQSDCATAQKYRQHLLHLPCHQTLTEAEMKWMTSALSLVLKQPQLDASAPSPSVQIRR